MLKSPTVNLTGFPHDEAGQIPVAFVVRKSGSLINELKIIGFVAKWACTKNYLFRIKECRIESDHYYRHSRIGTVALSCEHKHICCPSCHFIPTHYWICLYVASYKKKVVFP